ncbi:hypothetical protein GGI35DRAFT_102545 [Trichoderma velutinum]
MASPPSSPPTPIEHSSSPPDEPRPWMWACHECSRRYRISCTRRCLCCDHVLCFAYEGDPKETPSCIVKFDYRQWTYYTRWRRRIQEQRAFNTENQANTPAEEAENAEPDESQNTRRKFSSKSMLRNGTYSCFDRCSFPGYCIHKLRGMEEAQASSPASSSSVAVSTRSSSVKLKIPNNGKKRKPSRRTSRTRRSRRRHNFQKKPSPLSQVWQLESDSSEDEEMINIEDVSEKNESGIDNEGCRMDICTCIVI